MKTFIQIQLLAKILIAICIAGPLCAQSLNHVQGNIMISLDLEATPNYLTYQLSRSMGMELDLDFEQVASVPLNVWLLKFDHNTINEIRLLQKVKFLSGVNHAQYNHVIKLRNTPNDSRFNEQWQYINTGASTGTEGADLDMDLAWDIATGGLTAQGDTIVVAVIDDGIDRNHEDLKDNLWKNYAEIPNNGIDDDNNGYIDDYLGWNSIEDNDNIDNDDHGTSVSGIIGAKGNNGIGVAGVNWNVKIMTINAIPAPESGVVAAYSYVWTQRKRYNDTNGLEGAFVVAANSSFGLGVSAEDTPIWCDFYNVMGEEGIVSAGATSNSGVDVDLTGDVPSNCTSDYLIVVTNITWDDEKRNAAGYGASSVDLGAYGQNVFTTYRNKSYSSSFGGTSAATPHVTGVAALLYSMDCDELITEAKNNPSGAALAVKNYILDGVVPNESLLGITTSEGKLNAANTLQLGVNACSDCPPPIAFTVDNTTPFSAEINWSVVDGASSYDLRYREKGASNWEEISSVSPSYLLGSLIACSTYEVGLKSNCTSGNSDFGFAQNVLTTGCCELPELISADSEGDNVFFTWSEDEFVSTYLFEYRLLGSEEWISETLTENNYVLTEVTPCISYEARLTSMCVDFNSESEISDIIVFTTECGSCTGAGYCSLEDVLDNGSEWLDSIAIGDIMFKSGKDENAYGNYLGGPSTSLLRGSLVPLTLVPGFTSTVYDEYFTVWIDWNNDEMFDEETELAFESTEPSSQEINGTLFVPETANLGSTRMRVIMNFDTKQGPCGPGTTAFRFGEVEDYCVEVTNINSTNNLLDGLEISLVSNPIVEAINFDIISESSIELRAGVYMIDGKLVLSETWITSAGNTNHTLDATQLSSGLYLVNVTDGNRSSTYKIIIL